MSNASDMTKGEPLGLLIRFALPLVIGNLLQAAYSIVDRVIVGQFVGADAFSAVGVTYAPSNMFASVCIGMSTGAGIIVAQYFGAGKKEDIAKAISNTVYISIALAIIASIVGIAATEPFLHLLNTPENLMAPAALYMRIYLGGLVAVSAYYTPFSIIRALGDSRTPLIFLAEKYHKSPVQIILRWHIQEGTVVFPKSLNPEHIAIIHSYLSSVINGDNKTITLAHIGRIIWIGQIIKRQTNTIANNL